MTRDEADRVLMACREADPTLFGSAWAETNDDRWLIRVRGSDGDAIRAMDIVAKAAVLVGVIPTNGVKVSRGGVTIGTRRFDGER